MRVTRWSSTVAVAATVVGVCAATTIPSQAAVAKPSPSSAPAASARHFAKIDPSLLRGLNATKFLPAVLSDKKVTVVLQLAGAPVAVQSATLHRQGLSLDAGAKSAVRAGLAAQQDRLRARLADLGAHVVGQMQDAYNGIQIIVPQRSIAALAALPNVTAIHAVRAAKLANVNGIPFIGATTAWGMTTKNGVPLTGKGVKIAIIDTGIDYTHADFGGEGTPAAYQYALAHDTEDPATDPRLAAQFGPSAPKVIGGYDFVGDAYNADVPADSTPVPDKNPLDCNSHGTHTAGTLTGFGVLADGKTYTGSYNSTTVTPHDPQHKFLVGPGAAPQASLLVYRVFGCTGSTNVDDLAINQAVKDGASVISMSLGSPYGGTTDPSAVAAQNAVNDGVVVVAAAGNEGQAAYLAGSPASASGVISVAAMDASLPTYPGATLTLSTGQTVTALDANGAPIPSGTYPLDVLKNPDGSIALGCSASDYAGTAGKVVVVMRGVCDRVARAIYGDEAGDAAVLMVNTTDTLPPFEGQITSDAMAGVHTVTIPFLGAKSSDGPTLLAADGGTVSLASTTVANTTYGYSASFTSGGPRFSDSAPKPDVIAPGVSVTSAGMGTGTGGLVDSGTSMATPMVAGVATLVKEAHPDWQATQIKAAIMNTAVPSLNADYDPRIAGAGVVQAQLAVDTRAIMSTNDQLDAVAFGYVPSSTSYTDQKAVTITNYGASAQKYTLSVAATGSSLGATITPSPSSVSVPAGSSRVVQIELSMPASAFAALPSDDTGAVGPGVVTVARGDIVATPNRGKALHVPYLLAPRGLSDVVAGAASSSNPKKNAISSTITLSNDGVHDGGADLYSWGITDPQDANDGADVRDAGVQVLPGAALGSTTKDRGLVFLVNTWKPVSNQAVNEYDVSIDTNGDGVPDYVVVGADLGLVTAGEPDGEMAAFVYTAAGVLVDAFLANAPMNGTTIELPLLASDIGLTSKSAPFVYTVTGFDGETGTADPTNASRFNVYHPDVTTGLFSDLAPGTTDSFAVTARRNSAAENATLGWLVASTDDASGAAQADEVPLP